MKPRELWALALLLILCMLWWAPPPLNAMYWLTTKYGKMVSAAFADIGASVNGQILYNRNGVVRGIAGFLIPTGGSDDTIESNGGVLDMRNGTFLFASESVTPDSIEDGAITIAKIAAEAFDPSIDTNIVTFGELSTTVSATVDSTADAIPCGVRRGLTIATVTVTGGSYTLTSNPQITGGVPGLVCGITVADGNTNTLTIVDGNGVANYLDYSVPISAGKIEWYRWEASNSTFVHLATPLSSCTTTSVSGRLTLNCGAGAFVTSTIEATGSILGLDQNDTISASTATLLSTGMRGQNYFVTVSSDITLPTPAAGLNACFVAVGAVTITLDLPGGSGAAFYNLAGDGAAHTTDNAIDSPGTAGATICLKTRNTTQVWITAMQQTWVDGGPD